MAQPEVRKTFFPDSPPHRPITAWPRVESLEVVNFKNTPSDPEEKRYLMEGCFAINKPLGISSAQVLRDIQEVFNPSRLFAPAIAAEKERRRQESQRQKGRRSAAKRGPVQVKIGHGGTLDPYATGVLICGIGGGTKSLADFLTCTKTYECVVLFGAATDTYDAVGKVVARKPYEHITKDMVLTALHKFEGKIMQKPPIYSALNVQGKRLYEYAREGLEVPIEIKSRPVEVHQLEMTEWLPAGSHKFTWPDQEAAKEDKAVAGKLLNLEFAVSSGGDAEVKDNVNGSELSAVHQDANDAVQETLESQQLRDQPDAPTMSGALPVDNASTSSPPPVQSEQSNSNVENLASVSPAEGGEDVKRKRAEEGEGCEPESKRLRGDPSRTTKANGPPAARIRMTVSSGFYVRSLCHDLGAEVGSLGLMASLIRSRQEIFELGKNVFEYEDLKKGEDLWGPQIESMLFDWSSRRRWTTTHAGNEAPPPPPVSIYAKTENIEAEEAG